MKPNKQNENGYIGSYVTLSDGYTDGTFLFVHDEDNNFWTGYLCDCGVQIAFSKTLNVLRKDIYATLGYIMQYDKSWPQTQEKGQMTIQAALAHAAAEDEPPFIIFISKLRGSI